MSDDLQNLTAWLTTSGLKIIGILTGLLVIYPMSRRIVRWLEKFVSEKDPLLAAEAKKRAQTLGSILRQTFLVILSFIAILMILGELGIELGPLLATAGVGALAIGFGAQSLVKDVINGFFILLENQYRIGDVVEGAGVSGLVESVSLRKTVLRDLNGRVHIIPNGEIKIVTNFSKEWSRCVLDIGVSYREDVDAVIDLLSDIGGKMAAEPTYQGIILEHPQILGLEQFGESQVIIRLMVKTAPLKQWDVGRELRRRIKRRFDEKGIEIPFPHRVLLWGATGQKNTD